jgi:hypothetical protein
MADHRLTQREKDTARRAERRKEMDVAIAEGRLVVRQMTADERAVSDAGAGEREAIRQRRRVSRSHYLM